MEKWLLVKLKREKPKDKKELNWELNKEQKIAKIVQIKDNTHEELDRLIE